MVDLPRRCEDYRPTKHELDQRTGKERWPNLMLSISQMREIEAHAKSKGAKR